MKLLVLLATLACYALPAHAQSPSQKQNNLPASSTTLNSFQPLPVSTTQVLQPAEVASTSVTTGGHGYYVSSSMGDDSRSSDEAQSAATPWRSLKMINSFFHNMAPGDAVYLKRGDTFYEPLVIGKSGTFGANIIISAYGSGEKPIINGFKTLQGWTSKGNGIYESDCASCDPKLNTVIINGIIKAKGRYPNPSAHDKGYLTWESHSGNTSITDNELTSAINWTGGEVVTRKEEWNIDKNPITNHSGSTITYLPQSDYPTHDGWGYFIQGHPSTLDQFGEWYFEPTAKKLQVYFGTTPERYTTRASIIDTLVYLNRKSYITIDNISINGADKIGLQLDNITGVVIQNCDINNSGIDGINGEYTYDLHLINNTINNSLCNGINLVYYAYGDIIRGNLIKNTGLFPGMGRSGDGTYCGIQVYLGKNNIIEYNEIDSTGYIGIGFYCDSILIKNNLVNYFDLTKQDGGGIYACAHNNGDPINNYGKKIIGNIVLNGIGIVEGTNNHSYIAADGIYIDNRNTNIEILDNTVAHCAQSGVFNHESHDLTITGNTLFDNGTQIMMNQGTTSPNDPMRNNIVKNNIAYTNNDTQFIGIYRSPLYDVPQFGSFDNNFYAKTSETDNVINTVMNGEFKFYSLSTWKATYSHYEQNSTFARVSKVRFEYNASQSTKTIPLDGVYVDPKNNTYVNVVNLAPYTSVILIKSADINAAIPNSENASESAPTADTVALTGTSSLAPIGRPAASPTSTFNMFVYPNPATDFITVTNTGLQDGNIRLSIYDAGGRRVQTKDLVKKGSLTANMDVHTLHAGLYYMEFSFADGSASSKPFIKQ